MTLPSIDLRVLMLLGVPLFPACSDPALPAEVPDDVRAFSDDFLDLNERYCAGAYPAGSGHEGSYAPCIEEQRLTLESFPTGQSGCFLAITRDVPGMRENFRRTAECLAPLLSDLRSCFDAGPVEHCRQTYYDAADSCFETEEFRALQDEMEGCGLCEIDESTATYCVDEFTPDYEP